MVTFAPSVGSAEPVSLAGPHSGFRFTLLLIFTQMPSVLIYTVTMPLLAGMSQELAHDPASAYLVKLVLGVVGPAILAGALLAAWLAGRYDRRPLLIWLCAIYIVGAMAPAFVKSLEFIVVTRFVAGVASGAMLTIGMTMVGDYLPEAKRAPTLGMMGSLGMVSSLLSLPVAGFIGNGGWRLPFLLYLAVAPLIILALPSALPAPRSGAGDVEPGKARARWFTRLPFGLLVLALAVGNLAVIPGIYISFHLASLGLGKTSTIGLLIMSSSIIAAGSSAIFGKLWAKSPKFVYCLEFATLGLSMITLAYAPGLALAIVAMILMGLGMGLLIPSVMTRAVDTGDEALRGKVVGIVQGTLAVAPLLGLTLLEPLLPAIGTRGALLAVAGLSFCLLAGFAAWRRP